MHPFIHPFCRPSSSHSSNQSFILQSFQPFIQQTIQPSTHPSSHKFIYPLLVYQSNLSIFLCSHLTFQLALGSSIYAPPDTTIHSATYAFIHPLIRSPHPYFDPSFQLFIQRSIGPVMHPFIQSSIHPAIHLYIQSTIQLFIDPSF